MLSANLNVPKESWRVLLRNLLILLAVIAGVAYSAFLIVLPFGLLSQPETRLAVFLVGTIIGELAALLVLIWLLARKQTRLSDLGLGQPTTWQAIVLGVVVAFVYSGLTALNPMVGTNLLSFSPLKALAIMTAVIAGVVEEIIFRGYVMTVLARMGYRSVVQVLVSAVAFAIAHLYGFGSPGTMLGTQGMTLLLGIALGTVYVIGKRSLTPVMVSHILIDTIVEPWLLLSFFHL